LAYKEQAAGSRQQWAKSSSQRQLDDNNTAKKRGWYTLFGASLIFILFNYYSKINDNIRFLFFLYIL
jgi:hypothetical protein